MTDVYFMISSGFYLLAPYFSCDLSARASVSQVNSASELRFISTASHSGKWRAEPEDIFDSASYLACSFFQELLAGCLVLWGKISLTYVSQLRSKRWLALQLSGIIAKTIKQTKTQAKKPNWYQIDLESDPKSNRASWCEGAVSGHKSRT